MQTNKETIVTPECYKIDVLPNLHTYRDRINNVYQNQ